MPSATPPILAPSDWTTLVATSPEQGDELVSELGVPRQFYLHALDEDELPRMEASENATLIVLRVPWSDGEQAKEPWTTRPLGLVLLPGRVVAISRAPHPVLDAIARYADEGARRQSRLVLHALQLVAEAYLRELGRINRTVDRLEDALRASLENREVLELLKCQRGFVYFATALRSMELLLERLQKSQLLHAAPEDAELLDDVRVEIRQALDMTQTSADILSEMMDAFASIISNNLNRVMKFLAAFTVILMIPTLIASFYGMNVELPLASHPLAFLFMVVFSLVLSTLLAVVFVVRRWL
jgi:magnesium transporter